MRTVTIYTDIYCSDGATIASQGVCNGLFVANSFSVDCSGGPSPDLSSATGALNTLANSAQVPTRPSTASLIPPTSNTPIVAPLSSSNVPPTTPQTSVQSTMPSVQTVSRSSIISSSLSVATAFSTQPSTLTTSPLASRLASPQTSSQAVQRTMQSSAPPWPSTLPSTTSPSFATPTTSNVPASTSTNSTDDTTGSGGSKKNLSVRSEIAISVGLPVLSLLVTVAGGYYQCQRHRKRDMKEDETHQTPKASNGIESAELGSPTANCHEMPSRETSTYSIPILLKPQKGLHHPLDKHLHPGVSPRPSRIEPVPVEPAGELEGCTPKDSGGHYKR
ncbi:MAG: hypothetical protein MMC33_000841 [Icmadophila ericetorum]|nr:hypothetical protein [Icmadophila ericetorum]